MKKNVLIFLFLFGCTDKRPDALCQGAGRFVMTLKNERGRIAADSSGKLYLRFSPEGSLNYTTLALPCNPDTTFRTGSDVFFDGDFYEPIADSTAAFIVYLRHIEYQ